MGTQTVNTATAEKPGMSAIEMRHRNLDNAIRVARRFKSAKAGVLELTEAVKALSDDDVTLVAAATQVAASTLNLLRDKQTDWIK